MSAEVPQFVVKHNENASRFEAAIDGKVAILTYRQLGKSLFIDHTEVPSALEGRGIASKLAQTALEFARSQRLEVVPLCPYVGGYLRKHPEYQDLLSAKNRKRLLADK